MGIKNTKESEITYRVSKSILKLDHIEIEDPKMWDVLKVEDFVDNDGDQSTAAIMDKRRSEFMISKSRQEVPMMRIDAKIKVEVHAPLFF